MEQRIMNYMETKPYVQALLEQGVDNLGDLNLATAFYLAAVKENCVDSRLCLCIMSDMLPSENPESHRVCSALTEIIREEVKKPDSKFV